MENKLDDYISLLNEEQKQAVVHEGSPLLILAGAGSGKTRVITTKVAYLIKEKEVNPYSILAVTFTKKAANEMRTRAITLEPESEKAAIKTFHSFGSWFLRKYADRIGVSSSFTVYDDEGMALLLREVEPSLSSKEATAVAKQISLAKDYCCLPDDDLTFLASEFDIAEIYKKYNQRLRTIGNADFGDLIMLPYMSLKNDLSIASEVHARFKVIMVDEYQDSNIAQYKLLQELSGVKTGNDSYVCVVGDDDQSIYHFRGAEVKNILSFPDQFPGTQIIKLEKNYRSMGLILNAADAVVSHNVSRLGKTLEATRGEGKKPVLAYLEDQTQEAQFCSELIMKSLEKGGNYNDWAILYRTNAQSLTFEKEFLRRKIPYVLVGSLKFYEREEIKDILAYISLLANPKDEISFRRIVNKPARGIGPKTQDTLVENAFDGNQYKNQVDLLVGGSPCQSFSTMGYQKGLEDSRGTLFYEFARLVKEIEPKVFIYENVQGLLHHDKGKTWSIISEIFKSLGYFYKFKILNSKDYGIPQNRNRMFENSWKCCRWKNSECKIPNCFFYMYSCSCY